MFKLFKSAATTKAVYVFTHQRPDADAYGSAMALAVLKDGKAWFSEQDWCTRPRTIAAVYDKYSYVLSNHVQVGGEVPWDADVYVTDSGDPGRVSIPSELAPSIGLNVVASYDHHPNAPIGRGPQHGSKAAASASWVVAATEAKAIAKMDGDSRAAVAALLWAGHLGDTARFSVGDVAAGVMQAGDIQVEPEDARLVNSAYAEISLGRAKLMGAFWGSLYVKEYALSEKLAVSVLSNADFDSAGASRADYAGMPGMLLYIAGVTVAAAVCQDTRDPAVWRIAFRSKAQGIGWAQRLARMAGGDGHPDAAGGVCPDGINSATAAKLWAQNLLEDNAILWTGK